MSLNRAEKKTKTFKLKLFESSNLIPKNKEKSTLLTKKVKSTSDLRAEDNDKMPFFRKETKSVSVSKFERKKTTDNFFQNKPLAEQSLKSVLENVQKNFCNTVGINLYILDSFEWKFLKAIEEKKINSENIHFMESYRLYLFNEITAKMLFDEYIAQEAVQPLNLDSECFDITYKNILIKKNKNNNLSINDSEVKTAFEQVALYVAETIKTNALTASEIDRKAAYEHAFKQSMQIRFR